MSNLKKSIRKSLVVGGFCMMSSLAMSAQISLTLENKSTRDVIREIERVSEYRFFYNEDLQGLDQKININASDANIQTVLNEIQRQTSIHYVIKENNQIVLSAGVTSDKMQQVGDSRIIKGTILDATGMPVIGTNVMVKGTTNGTITDMDGKFSLEVDKNAILVVSYIGYANQEIKVGNQNTLSITMKEDAEALDELVVVGYGVQKKVNLTGAVSNVKADLLQNRTSSNPANMLTGNVVGVTLVQNSGQPGADAATLRVGGIGSLGNSEAMVIVDGIESSLDNVNPSDIENISVLKDAAAASIYGVRAANGVILVTTKRGATGKPIISYDGYIGWQQASRLPKYLDSYNYGILINEAYMNDGLSPLYSEAELQKMKDGSDPDHYANSDWLGTLFSENGLFHNHYLSVKGGNEAVKYAISLGYHDKEGLMPNTDYNKFSVRSNLDAKINDRLDVSLNLSAYRDCMTSPAAGVSSIMAYAFRESPVMPIQYQNGNYGLYLNDHNSIAYARNSGLSHVYNNNFLGSASFNYKIIDGLTLKGIASTTFNLKDQHDFLKKMDFYRADETEPYITTRSSVKNNDNKMLELNLQAYLNYDKTFGKHSIKGLLGYSQIYNQYRILEATRKDLPSNNSLGEINAGDENTQTTQGNLVEYALRSAFARVNYVYDDRYLFEANVRYDGTSRFPKNNRFGAFPSFSLGWRLSEEEFFDIPWIDNLKLRASWGLLGNQEIGDYAFYNTYVFGENYNFGNVLVPGISINSNMANTNITWEKTDQLDAGVDMDLLGGKLNFTGDFFLKNTKDILLRLPIADIVGCTAPMQNAGEVRNIGVEFQLNHNNQINDFNYFATFNFSYIHNEITNLSGGDTPGRSVGDPIANIYGYVCEGIYNTQEEIDNHAKQTWGAKPGDLIYKDINSDGIVDEEDRVSLGSYFPKINFGLRLGFEYKNFDFSALMQGAGMVNAIVKNEINKAFYNGGKVTEEHLDRWTPDNPDASYFRLSMKDSQKNWMNSSFWMQNSSYLKMRNIQLGYTIPKTLLSDYGISRLRLYFSADNLFTITGFDGVDPESTYDVKNLSGSSYYPLATSYSFGVNLSF